MSMNVPLLRHEEILYESAPVIKYEGRLNGKFVRSILRSEIAVLQPKVVNKFFCGCIPFRGLKPNLYSWEQVPAKLVPLSNIQIRAIASGVLILSFLCMIIVVIVTSDSVVSFGAVIIWLGVGGCSLAICFRGYLHYEILPKEFYERYLAQQIDHKRVAMLNVCRQISDDVEIMAPIPLLAGLFVENQLSIDGQEKLLAVASCEELKMFLTEFNSLGITSITANSDTCIWMDLIQGRPIDVVKYKENLVRVEALNLNEVALNLLRNALPPDDPRNALLTVNQARQQVASARPDHIAIDIPIDKHKKVTLWLGEESLDFDREFLQSKSSWFNALINNKLKKNENITDIKLEEPILYEELLLELLTHIHTDYDIHWNNQKTTAEIIRYIEIYHCAVYYGFEEIIINLGTVIATNTKIDTKDALEIGERVVTSDKLTLEQKNSWALLVGTKLKTVDENGFTLWMDFAVKYFARTTVPFFMGDFTNTRKPREPHVVHYLLRHQPYFASFMPTIVEWIREALASAAQAYIVKHPDFVEYCGELMKDPSSKLITTNNFKLLWECPEWSACPSVREALIKFAQDPAHTSALIQLWPIWRVPPSLIRVLPV